MNKLEDELCVLFVNLDEPVLDFIFFPLLDNFSDFRLFSIDFSFMMIDFRDKAFDKIFSIIDIILNITEFLVDGHELLKMLINKLDNLLASFFLQLL